MCRVPPGPLRRGHTRERGAGRGAGALTSSPRLWIRPSRRSPAPRRHQVCGLSVLCLCAGSEQVSVTCTHTEPGLPQARRGAWPACGLLRGALVPGAAPRRPQSGLASSAGLAGASVPNREQPGARRQASLGAFPGRSLKVHGSAQCRVCARGGSAALASRRQAQRPEGAARAVPGHRQPHPERHPRANSHVSLSLGPGQSSAAPAVTHVSSRSPTPDPTRAGHNVTRPHGPRLGEPKSLETAGGLRTNVPGLDGRRGDMAGCP